MSNKKDSISAELNKAVQEAEKHNSWFSNSNILNALSYWENKLNKNVLDAWINQYNIVNFNEFEKDKNLLSSNIACTVLKVQEKKTQKGNSYAIVKLSDLSNVFELFIFSDVFEINRDKLIANND